MGVLWVWVWVAAVGMGVVLWVWVCGCLYEGQEGARLLLEQWQASLLDALSSLVVDDL